MRNTVAPADLRVETAIVGHVFQETAGLINQPLPSRGAHPGFDAIGASDLGKNENGKRMRHAVRVGLLQQLVQLRGQELQARGQSR